MLHTANQPDHITPRIRCQQCLMAVGANSPVQHGVRQFWQSRVVDLERVCGQIPAVFTRLDGLALPGAVMTAST